MWNALSSVREKGFHTSTHMYFGLFLVFGNSKDRFSHDMAQLALFESQLEKIKDMHEGNKLPSVHILGDFNFCDIVWPDRLSKSGSPLSPSEGEKFIEILNDHHLEQLVHFRKVSELAERKGILVIKPCYIYIWQV